MGLLTALFTGFLSLATLNVAFCNGGCKESERQALLKLKQDMVHPADRLASWVAEDEDCCRWKGVVCDNMTGHVLELNLNNGNDDQLEARLGGKISPSLLHLKHLRYLDLSNNYFGGIHIPKFFGSLKSLRILNLSCSGFAGEVPHHLANQFQGPIPYDLQNLTLLRHLDLSSNDFNSSIPDWLGNFSSLQFLRLFENSFEGCISNSLQTLSLDNCQLFGQLTNQLGDFKILKELTLTDNLISGPIPTSIGELQSLEVLYLYGNKLNGSIPESFGQLVNLEYVDISENSFDGSIPESFGQLANLEFVDISQNSFKGQNFLSGELPDCWAKWPKLEGIVLSNNGLTGGIPRSIGTLSNLLSLHLQKNNLSREIPLSLSNCTELEVLQLSENELDGSIPPWVGKSLSNLIILNLGSNEFSGHIPSELCSLNHLQILDLAHNNLFGSLPRCIGNISVLQLSNNHSEELDFGVFSFGSMFEVAYLEYAFVSIKGQLLEYDKTLHLVKVMDFSGNSLSGEIPSEITYLQGLQSLNLSHNLFTGRIPHNIGNMRRLESVDFSGNKLSGSIPGSMSSLTFLSYLNLSNNQLTGQIPSGTQLQSFDASSYARNKLCGLPLPNKCSVNPSFVPSIQNRGGKDGNGVEIIWLFASVALGFIVGFWSVLGPLVISKQWRCMYYQFLEEMWWKISDSVNKYF
ncbi:hypothetical protein SLA2020_069920 [Shorea laevis]